MMKSIKHKKKGFSLIEVAIAVVIIGLVVGFTIKGKELIHTAKLNAIAEQVNSFKIATQIFIEKYGALPSDFANAKSEISDSLDNGNGNGTITSLDDAKRFWKHLIASDLISTELSHNGLPTSKFGGCFSVSSNINGHDGIWLILCLGTSDNSSFQAVISQEDAYRIDKKNDNGNPSTGEIRTVKASGLSSLGNTYDPKNKSKDCIIMFRIW